MSGTQCRVLSIQSHVVSGYAGNKSATFPLQVLGFEVDTINSVQFSNHTGYKYFKGQVLSAKDIDDLFDGLRQNDIHHYSHLLTGYMGDPTFLEKICEVVAELKKVNPKLTYVCDPVMGDNGKLYVPVTLLPIYKEKILPLVDILTPNQFEAELLTDTKIKTEADAMKALEMLLDTGAKTVVMTSSEFAGAENLICLGLSASNGTKTRIRIEIPRLDAIFVGSGDLFAALLLARLQQHPNDLKLAAEKVVATMQAVLKRTLKCAQELAGPGNATNCAQMELKLIQSKVDIENPKIIIEASQV